MRKQADAGFSVSFFQRKPHSVGNYSVEFIFEDVRQRLQEKIEARVYLSHYRSTGVLKRLYNCLEAAFRQSGVNHITGDINYLGIFLKKKRTVQTILDCVHMETSRGIRHALLKFFWITVPVKRCSFVTAISESTKREILRYASCDPEKIVVIPVAISPAFLPRPRSFNKNKPLFLQIGTSPNKNIPRLIEAVREIPCRLHIVGRQNPQYVDLLKASGIDFVYESGLSDAEVRDRYEQADLVCFTSTYEGFGMPILEGQSVGRPVVTSNLLSMPEVAGGAAELVDPYDVNSIREGILRVIRDDGYREELVRNGFENVKRFDPQRIAEMYFSLYHKIAAR
jgi:glycosyltransferase involved in cell wall biosynthesis